MKHYYIIHGDFANRYALYWAENRTEEIGLIARGAVNITRREAIAYAREERERRAYNPAFACYADDRIYPCDTRHNPAHKTDSTGHIVLKEV